MLLFSIKDRHHTSTDEKCSWTRSRLGNNLARVISISGFLYLQIWIPTPTFPVGFCKRWSFSSTGHYSPEQRIKKVTANTEQLLLQNVFAGHILLRSFCIVYKNFLSFSPQQCAFIIYVAITHMPLNKCQHIYYSNWGCHKNKLTECSPIKF